MKKKLFMTFVGIAIISFAAYSSFQNQEEKIVLSEMAMENAEALAAEDVNPLCPNGCIDGKGDCFCYIPTTLASFKWPKK